MSANMKRLKTATARKGSTKRRAATRPAAVTYLLRTCRADGTSYNGFKWPKKGKVVAPDWKPTPACGNGLHGLLLGQGDASLLNWHADAIWQVVKVKASEVVEIPPGKVKVPRGVVVFSGARADALAALRRLAPHCGALPGEVVRAGDRGTATAGYGGTATAGYGGTATAGYGGTATAGNGGTATAGYRGTATAGYGGTATAGWGGTATAGWGGTATAGDRGTATAGDGGTATAGYGGTATAGNGGTATAGDGGTATAGYGGELRIGWWDQKSDRRRTAVAYVGENGIEPNVKYKLNDAHEFVRAEASPC